MGVILIPRGIYREPFEEWVYRYLPRVYQSIPFCTVHAEMTKNTDNLKAVIHACGSYNYS